MRATEDLGFHGLYLSDHFNLPEPPDAPSLDLMVALTYLADHTERVRFGPMVAPVSFRDPVMLARQAAALDDLSGGRMVLGMGTGWMEREHRMFGYDLGDTPARFARLEEGLEIVTRLLRSDTPVSYDGGFFCLRDAVLPEPRRATGPPIMLGGKGPRRTLPLVARFADIWNAKELGPEQIRERSALLDELLLAAGRQPADVRRSLYIPVLFWSTSAELERRLQPWRRFPPMRHLTDTQLVEQLRAWPGLVGTLDEIAEHIEAFAAAGIGEIAMRWTTPDDIEGLEQLAQKLLPRVTTVPA